MSETISMMVGPGALALIGSGGPLLIKRDQLATITEFLVALQDICEPESDCETTDAEDDFAKHRGHGAGCEISDPDKGVDDDPEGVEEGI